MTDDDLLHAYDRPIRVFDLDDGFTLIIRPARSEAEQSIRDAVAAVRSDGQSWAAIGTMLGTSGEAARQRYGHPRTA